MTPYEQEAYELGQEHGRNAAAWIVDGNTSQEHTARMVAWMDDGDPRRPDLSGEYADDLTPSSLYADIVGTLDDPDWELMTALANAYEAGVDDTFYDACEAELRRALS